MPEQVSNITIKGEVENVLRDADRTEVIVLVCRQSFIHFWKRKIYLIQEGNTKIAYELDNTQVEFASALEQHDFERAIAFLEKNESKDR